MELRQGKEVKRSLMFLKRAHPFHSQSHVMRRQMSNYDARFLLIRKITIGNMRLGFGKN